MIFAMSPTQIFLTATVHIILRRLAMNDEAVKFETRRNASAGLKMLQQWRVCGELFRTTPAVDVAWKMR